MSKIVIGLFDDFNHASQAVEDLTRSGFRREDISLIANDKSGEYGRYFKDRSGESTTDVSDGAVSGAGIGAVLGGLGGLLVGLGALAIPGIGPVLAAGPLISALAGAGIGAAAGGLLGALVDAGIPEEQAQYYTEGVRRGGTLVSVTSSDEMAQQAVDILNRHNPVDVKRRAQEWQSSGWSPSSMESMRHEEMKTPDMSRTSSEMGSPMREDLKDEATFPVVDEEQRVGKPEVGFGDVRNTTGMTGYDEYEPMWRSHYQTTFTGTGHTYDEFQPAYHYGYDLASDPRYHGRDWATIEPEARRDWEMRYHDSAWDDFKDAIRQAWDTVTGQR